ncbi:serine/threonine-protein kinase M1 [Diplodia seriata]|uniref:Serine/threonine-protein kinase M1 n=1 Tax=Diplodia seriata TaxID=420778 RepID=A0ABR3CVY0_9PEZI
MARKAGDPAPRVSADGTAGWGNGVPPPSTIAAQIVDNHSRANGAQEPQNNALFGQLLQEFLTDPSAEESDVRLNLQLVSVVVEAGFNALLKENPFGRDVLLSQARDGMSVIRITIERNPGLLFCPDPVATDHATHPPLVAKLLPIMFSLLSRPSLQSLHGELRELLHSFIQVLSTDRRTWLEANLLIETYQASISAILMTLESQSLAPHAPLFYKVTLPPPNTVSRLFPDGQQIVAIPQNCQMETSSPSQAANIALALVDAICKCLGPSWTTCIAVTVQTAMPDWVADGLGRLWVCCSRLNLLKKSQKDYVDLLLLSFLAALRSFSPQATPEQTSAILTPKTSTVFYETLSEITELICSLPACSTVQLTLSDILLTTIWLNRPTKSDQLPFETTSPTASIFNELFLSSIDSIAQDDTQTALLEHDLRVSALYNKAIMDKH